MRYGVIGFGLLLAGVPAVSVGQQVTKAPIEIMVPAPPRPMVALGRSHLVYELHLTNFGTDTLDIAGLVILGDQGPSPLEVIRGPQLATRMSLVGGPRTPPSAAIPPGRRAIAFLWTSLAADRPVPATLTHRLVVAIAGTVVDTVTGPAVPVLRDSAAPLRPPVTGGTWVAVRGPSNGSGHRLSVVALGGESRVPQRFAVDWVKLGPDGEIFRGDSTTNAGWYGYGDSVVSVASGDVVLVRDGIAENVPLSGRMAVAVDARTAPGNTVVVRLGPLRYAVYAHLQPGSIVVKEGSRVVAGQLLGKLGNSGNSLGPHLHFHVSTAVEPLGGEGLPFSIDGFQLVGRVESLQGMLTGKRWQPDPARPARRITGETPLENMVVGWPR